VFVDDAGTRLQLGPELGQGGEAPSSICGHAARGEIYHRPAEPAKAAKLRGDGPSARAGAECVSGLAERRVLDVSGTHTWGILLPKVVGHAIHELYSPADRRSVFQLADWTFLVRRPQLRRGVRGDPCRGTSSATSIRTGVFVSKQGTITLIDCDSCPDRRRHPAVHLRRRCPALHPRPSSGHSFRGLQRTPARRVRAGGLVFHLLFMGRHPFAGRYLGKGMPVERAIRGPIRLRPARRSPADDAAAALWVSQVPDEIAGLFERAFRLPGGSPHGRPTATEWLEASSA
jgi:DNA-binding helix-hairpin-helix protein with protein kinase domain